MAAYLPVAPAMAVRLPARLKVWALPSTVATPQPLSASMGESMFLASVSCGGVGVAEARVRRRAGRAGGRREAGRGAGVGEALARQQAEQVVGQAEAGQGDAVVDAGDQEAGAVVQAAAPAGQGE